MVNDLQDNVKLVVEILRNKPFYLSKANEGIKSGAL